MFYTNNIYSQDSIVNVNQEKKNFTEQIFSGYILIGTDLYSNNYYFGDKSQSNIFGKSDIALTVSGIPLKFHLNHSTISQLNFNKTFRLSFDKIKYDKLKKKMQIHTSSDLESLRDSLQGKRQEQAKKLAYSEYKIKNLNKFKVKEDTIKFDNIDYIKDSLTVSYEIKSNDTISKVKTIEKDSLELLGSIERAKIEIDKLNSDIRDIEEILKEEKQDKIVKTRKSFFDNIRTLEIGYAYPSYSKYLIRGNVLKGMNLEYEEQSRYLALSYGKIAKNFMNVSSQNPLEQFTSFFNTDYSQEKNVVAFKTGMGTKYGTHFFIGGLYGKGSTGNYFTLGSVPTNRNIVVEIDANLQIGKSGKVSIVYAKSFLSYNNLPQEDYYEFVSKKTNIGEAAFDYKFNRIIDKIEVHAKYSEPLFKSFGINYITTDYLNYDVLAHKTISNKLKFKLGYKKENYNIQRDQIAIKINSILAGLDYKITRKLKLSSLFNPSIGSDQSFSSNILSNLLLTYFDVKGSNQTSLTASFNDFRVLSDTSNFNIQSFVAGSNFTFNKLTLEGSVLHLRSMEIIQKYETIYNMNFNYRINKFMSFLIGGKYSMNDSGERSNGYLMKFDINNILLDKLNFSALYEKRVYSEMYYVNFINPTIFKYYSSVQLKYNF